MADANIEDILIDSGFEFIQENVNFNVIEGALRILAKKAQNLDTLQREALRQAAIKQLERAKVKSPARLVDAALKIARREDQSGRRDITFPEPEPWPEVVDGVELLDEIRNWINDYIVVSEESLTAITVWAVATWFVEAAYVSPILATLSPTKRSGKTLLLDLLRLICRKAVLTSGVGVTSAVIFRMNHQYQPTFLIDEAEKLSGKNADKEIIGLLNQGYRRGSKIQRCRERGGKYVVEEFDAFGFRALAAIGNLWDTIIDRAVVVSMKRKPKTARRRRYNGRVVENEGNELSRKICRFVQDNIAAFEELQVDAPRPEWVDDRTCDNWSALFTVARLAGGHWPEWALNAAKKLSNVGEDGDRAELLIHDTRRIFEEAKWPEVIQSGDLVQALNAIESSPWGDYSKGQGVTTHKVAALFRPFEIRSCQERDGGGEKIRGYWLKYLQEVFIHYPTLLELGKAGRSSNDGPSSNFPSGTKDESCPTSESPETQMDARLSQLSQSERGEMGGTEGNRKNNKANLPLDGKIQAPGDSGRPFTVVERI